MVIDMRSCMHVAVELGRALAALLTESLDEAR